MPRPLYENEFTRLLSGMKPARPAGGLPGVVLLYGPERFLLDRTLEKIRKKVLGEPNGLEEFNTDLLEAKTATASQILSGAQQLPVMAERRLVIVKAVDEMAGGEIKRLAASLPELPSTTVLVLTASWEKPKEIPAALQTETVCSVQCGPLTEDRVLSWLQGHAKSMGLTLNPDAAEFLVRSSGGRLHALSREMEKLALMEHENGVIRLEAVREVSVGSAEAGLWDLTQAVEQRRIETSLLLLHRLLEEGEPPVKILGSLARQFRRRPLKTAAAQGAIRSLLIADSRLKSGRGHPRVVLESLLLNLCRPETLRGLWGRRALLNL
jgi:DNA polymerase-3 subunit delta